MRPTELPDTIRIAFDGFLPSETGHPEPVFAGIAGLEEIDEPLLATSLLLVEFDEPARLDPERSGLIWEVPPLVAEWAMRWRAPLVSLAFHLLPVAMIMLSPLLVVEPSPPIPVQLVFEPPPPPPPPPPPATKPQPQPPPPKMEVGRLASVDMGAIKETDTLGRTADPVQPPAAGEQQPTPSEADTTATPTPSPKPTPPRKEQKLAFQLQMPSGANVPRRDATPREAPRSAKYPGPAATQDEYLAYVNAVIEQHLGTLPLLVTLARNGKLVLAIHVLDNGAIENVRLLQSSGNPEADMKIADTISSIHKFPPIPQWFQGSAVWLDFILTPRAALGQN